MASKALQELREHLKEMFQFDSELDFGIYKVLRLKRAEVSRFLDEELEAIIDDVLADVEHAGEAQRMAELTTFVKERGGADEQAWLQDLAAHADDLQGFVEYKLQHDEQRRSELIGVLRDARAPYGAAGDSDLQDRVYNHLIAFFGRYYRNGDFGYNDRSLATYKVEYPPAEADYDGSDVLLHWKHKDSFYVKTAASFPTVRFELDGETIEYRLETGGTPSLARNNNKGDVKHYRLGRIGRDDATGVWCVVFHLDQTSTPKTEIFPEIMRTVFGEDDDLDRYLYCKPGKGEERGKPIFTDLEGDYDKVQNGQKKAEGEGRSGLRTSWESYRKRLAARDEFRSLGGNVDARVQALADDRTASRLYLFDKHLNTFYIGVDADYFIHKDLKGFLTREAERYVKDTILRGVAGIFTVARDNTAVKVSEAFYRVAERLIELLAAVEDFQKDLFLLKKKVVQTEWLVSLGKLDAWIDSDAERRALIEEIHANLAQREEWGETFDVDVTDPAQLALLHPTLPIDTRHFDEGFKLRLLGRCPDLEEEMTGLLLNSENFQALRLLENSFRGKVRCIYIDPPYNTSGTDFLYQNQFRHSSWLSMMSDRIHIGSHFLDEQGMIQVAIDDYENGRLRVLMDDLLGAENYVATISAEINPAGQNIRPNVPARSHDYFHIYAQDIGLVQVLPRPLTTEEENRYPYEDEQGRYYWDNLRRRGGNSRPKDRPKQWYPIYVNAADSRLSLEPFEGAEEVWPIDPKGIKRIWRVQRATAAQEIEAGEISVLEKASRSEVVKKTRMPEGKKPKTLWHEPEYSATTHGTKLLNDILGPNEFTYPKSIHLVKDSIGYWASKNSIVLDFFAGSGSTGHAVLMLNKGGEDSRRFILVEMGEYFGDVCLERVRRVMYSLNWKDGRPKAGEVDGTVCLVKYQRLEQYEDVLDALVEDDAPLPDDVPLRYLYRPQEQRIRQSLDLTQPFDNTVEVGKDHEPHKVDVLETYAYLQGLPVQRIGVHRVGDDDTGREYRWFRSGRHLVVFRTVEPGEDDTGPLDALLDEHADAEVLHVNEYLDERHLGDRDVSVRVVSVADFDQGAAWS